MGKAHIPFNRVDIQGNELEYIQQAIIKIQISKYLFSLQIVYVVLK